MHAALAAAPVLLAAVGAAIFLLGGAVKGMLGVGMPLVIVPLMSLLIPAPQAMGLMVAPVLLANAWQACEAGRAAHLRRFAGFIVVHVVALVLTVRLSVGLPAKAFDVVIALAVLTTVATLALRPDAGITPRQERWAGPLAGALAGILGGLSSLPGAVIISYLVALRLGREEFVGSVSMLYLIGALPMYGSMLWWGRFGWEEVGGSVLALIPVLLGLALGTRVRRRLSEAVFRRLLFAFLVVLALLLLFK